MRQSIDDRDARRLLGGGPVTLVTTSWRGNFNVMPCVFATPLSIDPPLVGISVHPGRHTHDMIKYSEEFALNIPTQALLHHAQYLGSVTGSELDKFELTKLPNFRARRISAPLLEGCVGWIECGVHDAFTVGDHTLFVGKVVAAQAESDAFANGVWTLSDPEEKPLQYIGMNYYSVAEQTLTARIPDAGDIKRDVDEGAAQIGDDAETAQRREEQEQDDEKRGRG